MDVNNYLLLWLPRLPLAWDYSLLENRYLAYPTYTISAFAPTPHVYAGVIATVRARSDIPPWPLHIGWAAWPQWYAAAARLVENTCVYHLNVFLRLDIQHSVSPTH